MRVDQIAAQLYTTREFLGTPAEIAVTLTKLRQIGYQAVELAGLGAVGDDEIAQMLAGEGLRCCGTHEPEVLKEPRAVIERLQRLNCRYAVLPSPAGVDLANPAEVDQFIDALETTAAAFHRAGRALAYHNHAVEFVRLNNKTVLEAIFERTENVQAEIDTYWVQFGGGDPVEWCQRLNRRLPLIHLKDYVFTLAEQPAIAEIGSGNLNWRKIVAAAEDAGCQWFIVEQDETPGDPFESLAKSFMWLRENLC